MIGTQTLRATGKYNPIAVFNPLPWQVAPWRDKSRVLLLTGSAGGGKSRLAAEKIHGACLKYPGAVWLMMRKAREWNSKSIIPFYLQSVVGRDSRVKFYKSDSMFAYANGSIVYTGGMMNDEQREAVRSIGGDGGLDGAWLEEGNAFARLDFEETLGRMRHNAMGWRQIIITTNPGGSQHWIKRDLITGGGASCYYSGARDNPHNPEDYHETLGMLTGMMRKRLVEGIWATAEGAVYDLFDPARHVAPRPSGDFQRWFLAMDEGYTNPAVILLVGVDGDGRIHIAREFYRRGVLQSAVVKTAGEWARETEAYLVAVDAAAAGLIADLNNEGLPAQAFKGRVLDGITTVQDYLKVQNDGKPRLTVDPACVETINEFESYVWKPEKDEPMKENDHAMDALRYGVFHLAGGTLDVF